jgi:peptidoglycan/xylan/chitin deacetylase (PgdA/CDA1 family)
MSGVASARQGLKGVVEALLFHGGPARIGREVLRGRVIVLAYHNVVPPRARVRGDRALHLPLASFEAQLDLLRRTHEIVPLDSLDESDWSRSTEAPVDPGRTGRAHPRAVITFDDAYRGAVTAGVEALARRGLPATIFTAPHFLGERSFWWDAVPEARMTPGFREQALTALEGRDAEIRRWMESRKWDVTQPPAHQRCASLEELREAARRPGITVASHSWSHPNLTRLRPEEVTAELRRPADWLRAHIPDTIPWISYPYGLSSAAVEDAARAAGYRGALKAQGGWLPRPVRNEFALPRQNVAASLSIEGFGARSAGLLCG